MKQLHNLFYNVLNNYEDVYKDVWATGNFKNPLSKVIVQDIPLQIENHIRDNTFIVKGSNGEGRWTHVPWIAVFNSKITKSAKTGTYIVYLINSQTKELYLSFAIAADEAEKKARELSKKENKKYTSKDQLELLSSESAVIRKMIDNKEFLCDGKINCGKKEFDCGSVYYKKYDLNMLPDDDELFSDLDKMISIYDKYCRINDKIIEKPNKTVKVETIKKSVKVEKPEVTTKKEEIKMGSNEWREISPEVNEVSEFMEISSDFGDPLEVFRESLHNAYDWGATEFSVNITVEEIEGKEKLVLVLKDNGVGMSEDVLIHNFWNLGNSASRGNPEKIGEKGHGTKIYLRSDRVIVKTCNGEKSYESVCESPFSTLYRGDMHKPRIRESDKQFDRGTEIRIEGYNQDERTKMRQSIIKDYLYWYTVLGTVENQFEGRTLRDFKVFLKALDWDKKPEELSMGHPFAAENKNTNDLFSKYGENAADYYVKKFVRENETLPSKPEIRFDAVIYYEGDEAKRLYNPMIREKTMKASGTYKVSDRYGIWLCKDYVPIQRVNEWITSFGNGSNSFGLLHGFVNCQKLKLTANRGTIANTNPEVITELKNCIQDFINDIDADLYSNDVSTLRSWRDEARARKVEDAGFAKRKKLIRQKKYFELIDNYLDEKTNKIVKIKRTFLEPRNEVELYGLFTSLYTLRPDKFDFEPLDYDATVGIDLLARNKTDNQIADCEYWYVELKYQLGASKFNHSFKNIRYIVCWELSQKVKDGSKLESLIEGESRELHIIKKENGKKIYYLDNDNSQVKIKVICLKDYIEIDLGLKLLEQDNKH